MLTRLRPFGGTFNAILIPRCLVCGQNLFTFLPDRCIVSGLFRLLVSVTTRVDESSLCSVFSTVYRIISRSLWWGANRHSLTDAHARVVPQGLTLYCDQIVTVSPRCMPFGTNCRFLQGKDTDPVAVEELRRALQEERDGVVAIVNYRNNGEPSSNPPSCILFLKWVRSSYFQVWMFRLAGFLKCGPVGVAAVVGRRE